MKTPAIVAVTLFAVSTQPFQSVQAQSTSGPSPDAEVFEFRWNAPSSDSAAGQQAQLLNLKDEARAHCKNMADRSIAGYTSRRGFVTACMHVIEREVTAQLRLAERSLSKEKGARLARRPSSK